MSALPSTRRVVTRDEALSWNPGWSVAGIRLIGENLDRVGARTYYRTQSNGTVTVQDAEGRSAMYLHPGYVEFRKGLAAEDRSDLEWDGFALSCFRPREAPSPRARSG